MPAITQEREQIELPDFHSLSETTDFVEFLKGREDQYGVKTLLYHSEMIQGHLQRIAKHSACAEKILIRVNGSVSPIQRKAYDIRAARTLATKFYSTMSTNALEQALCEANLDVSMNKAYTTREEWIDLLVKHYIAKGIQEHDCGE